MGNAAKRNATGAKRGTTGANQGAAGAKRGAAGGQPREPASQPQQRASGHSGPPPSLSAAPFLADLLEELGGGDAELLLEEAAEVGG